MTNTDRMGRSPIHYAAVDQNLDEVKSLIADGADVNAREDASWTPLHFAAQSGSADIVEALLDAGAELEARNAVGRTPLSIAVMEQDLDSIQLLLDRGADPYLEDKRGNSAIRYISRISGRPEKKALFAQYLVEQGKPLPRPMKGDG